MDAMTYNIDTLPARDLRPVVDYPETEADYTPPTQAIHTAAQEEATAEVSAEAPAPEALPRRRSKVPRLPSLPSLSPPRPFWPWASRRTASACAAANTGSAILAELNRGTAVSILAARTAGTRRIMTEKPAICLRTM